jgi:large subunit ribosomal protein L10
MPRPEKVQAVAEIKERIEGAQAVFLAEYAGLSVKEQQELRRALRANDAEFKVVKMTLARRAADDLDLDSLDELLLGPTGLTFAEGDPVGAAKVLKDFSKDHEVFVIKGGLLGLDFLTPERISELADIEPREVLLSKLAGAMQAPLANLAGLLAALPRNTASVLQQLLEQKEASSEGSDAEAVSTSSESDGDEAVEETATDDADAGGEPDVADDADAEAAAASDAADDEGDEPAAAAETEDESEATVEASDDADDATEDEDDQEASDDAEEK